MEEELFCLNYELKNLSDLLFFDKAERWIKGMMYASTEKEHLDRYKFAQNYTLGKRVLDMACGSGYGSFLIATEGKADMVIGVDLDRDAIRYGNHRYASSNVERYVADATQFRAEEKFEVILSFETIEHVPDYELLLKNYARNLKEDGFLLISTPINKVTTSDLKNPYHVIEWSFFDFHKLIEKYFSIEEIYLQNIISEKKIIPKKVDVLTKIKFKFRPDLKENFFKKIAKQAITNGSEFEKYTNQYEDSKIYDGYQLLVVKNRK